MKIKNLRFVLPPTLYTLKIQGKEIMLSISVQLNSNSTEKN